MPTSNPSVIITGSEEQLEVLQNLLAELQLKADLTEIQPITGIVAVSNFPEPSANPATSILQTTQVARLEEIRDHLSDIKTYTDSLELLVASLNGYVDGLEALLITANATQTSLADFVDQIEGFVDEVEIKLGTLNDKDFATETTLDALLTELQGKADASETQPVVVANFPTTQQVSFSDSALITETALTAAGSTPVRSCVGYKYLTYQVDVTGIGTSATVRMEGNLVGTNFANLNLSNSDTILTQNKPYLFTFEGKISQVRFTLISFSGGSPSLTCHLLKGN